MDIFKLVGSVFVDTDAANDSLKKTDKQAETTSGKLGNIAGVAGKMALGLGAACAAGAAALYGVADSAAASLDEVQKGAQQLGISYEEYQKLSYACERSGLSIDNLSKGVKNITNVMAGMGTSDATAAMESLGVATTDASGAMRSQEDVLNDTLMALADMEDTVKRDALANDLFGASYQDLAPLLNSGSEGIQELMQNAEDLGLVMSDDAVDAGAQFQDTIADVKDSFSAIMTQIGAEVMPVIMELAQWIIDHMPEIQAVMQTVFGVIETVLGVVGEVLTALFQKFQEYWPTIQETVVNAIQKIVAFWNEELAPCFEAIVGFIQDVLWPAFQEIFEHILQPIIESFFKLFVDLWNDTLKPVLMNIIEFLTNVFSGNFSGAFKNLVTIVKSIWDGLVDVIKQPVNAVIGIVNSFMNGIVTAINTVVDALNALSFSFPDWIPGLGGKSFSLNLPHIVATQIPLLAKGGHIDEEGEAIIGEAGAELVELPQGATVTPLTGNEDPLNSKEMLATMQDMLAEMKAMNDGMLDTIQTAMESFNIKWDDRNLGRLVNKYVG